MDVQLNILTFNILHEEGGFFEVARDSSETGMYPWGNALQDHRLVKDPSSTCLYSTKVADNTYLVGKKWEGGKEIPNHECWLRYLKYVKTNHACDNGDHTDEDGMCLKDFTFRHSDDQTSQCYDIESMPKKSIGVYHGNNCWDVFPFKVNSPYGLARSQLLTKFIKLMSSSHFYDCNIICLQEVSPAMNDMITEALGEKFDTRYSGERGLLTIVRTERFTIKGDAIYEAKTMSSWIRIETNDTYNHRMVICNIHAPGGTRDEKDFKKTMKEWLEFFSLKSVATVVAGDFNNSVEKYRHLFDHILQTHIDAICIKFNGMKIIHSDIKRSINSRRFINSWGVIHDDGARGSIASYVRSGYDALKKPENVLNMPVRWTKRINKPEFIHTYTYKKLYSISDHYPVYLSLELAPDKTRAEHDRGRCSLNTQLAEAPVAKLFESMNFRSQTPY